MGKAVVQQLWIVPVSTADEERRRGARRRRVRLWWRDQCRVWHAGVRQPGMHRPQNTRRAQPRQLVVRRIRRSKRHAVAASTRPSYDTTQHVHQSSGTYKLPSPQQSHYNVRALQTPAKYYSIYGLFSNQQHQYQFIYGVYIFKRTTAMPCKIAYRYWKFVLS